MSKHRTAAQRRAARKRWDKLQPPKLVGLSGWLPDAKTAAAVEGAPLGNWPHGRAETFAERRARRSLEMSPFPSSLLPGSPAGRLAFAMDLLQGFELHDEDGNPTGERSEPVITLSQFKKIVEGM